MNRLKLAIRLESLGLPLRRALEEAQKLGVPGVQVDALGPLSPQQLTETGRREFRNLLRAHNLELSALGCPLRRGLDVAVDQQPRIEHVRKVMKLSYDLGARLVIFQPGRIPEKDDDPRADLLRESLLALTLYGDRVGTTLAWETGLEAGAVLADYLARYDTASLGVNFDPANLLMHGHSVFDSLRALRGKVVHAHARDARSSTASLTAQEVPLGHGDIDWLTLLGVLEEIEYRGWMAIERESGENRLADVAGGVSFLRRFLY